MEPNPISSWSLRAGTGDLLALAEQRRRRKDVGWTDEEKAKFFGIPKPGDEAATESAAEPPPLPSFFLFLFFSLSLPPSFPSPLLCSLRLLFQCEVWKWN